MNGSFTTAQGFLGVIVLDTRFPRPPGDIGCPDTWARAGIPARLRVVPGASSRRVVQAQDPALLGPFVDAARALAAEGAALITTSCGFLAAWQAELQAQGDVVAAAVQLVSRHPQVQTVVLECTNMPPYRAAVALATGRPVHDLETWLLVRWRELRGNLRHAEGGKSIRERGGTGFARPHRVAPLRGARAARRGWIKALRRGEQDSCPSSGSPGSARSAGGPRSRRLRSGSA